MSAPIAGFSVDIIIPTFNRAHLVERAVEAALAQSYRDCLVSVIDDESTDATEEVLRPYFRHPRFSYVRLARNLGTAGAKNAGLLLTDGQAVSFHDSDDIPERDKILRQVAVMTRDDVEADACLNWEMLGYRPGQRLSVGAVLTHHALILPDGRRVEIRRTLSLVDDIFPNLQMSASVPGDWTHVNSGLFTHEVFARHGGFAPCIEEDREFRNRLVLNGEIVWVIPEILMTKIETPDSLTQSAASDYASARRKADRRAVWDKVRQWREQGRVAPVPVDLPDLSVAFASAPARLALREMPMTDATRARLAECMSDFSAMPAPRLAGGGLA
ncbi:MAG: glycosyltransferase family 2 protein [Sedimentitalea sp.]|nr:glycosyltransferase family 2 protein [Sedimentitalea sp.]